MNENEWQTVFSGNSHLILKEEECTSSMVVCLPWLPKKRALAVEERSSLLRRLLSIWKSAHFIYDDEGKTGCSEVSQYVGADLFEEHQDIGGWVLIFGMVEDSKLARILEQDNLASMNAQSLLQFTGAPCVIASEPDNIEWTIELARP